MKPFYFVGFLKRYSINGDIISYGISMYVRHLSIVLPMYIISVSIAILFPMEYLMYVRDFSIVYVYVSYLTVKFH